MPPENPGLPSIAHGNNQSLIDIAAILCDIPRTFFGVSFPNSPRAC
jgi:hypothetical protein